MSSIFADQQRPAYKSPNAGGGGGSCGVSANQYSCAHHVTWSPNKLWRSNSIFNPCESNASWCSVGLWNAVYVILYALTNATKLMHYSTRSTEEIFALFICIAFTVDAFKEQRDERQQPNSQECLFSCNYSGLPDKFLSRIFKKLVLVLMAQYTYLFITKICVIVFSIKQKRNLQTVS